MGVRKRFCPGFISRTRGTMSHYCLRIVDSRAVPAHLRSARAIMNAWMPRSREGDVRTYSEAEMCRILGTWFSDVSWRRVGQAPCVAVARRGADDLSRKPRVFTWPSDGYHAMPVATSR